MDEFKEQIWDYYRVNARAMPWRDKPTFYYVLVSEIMLQQTQVSRVLPKFQLFIERFPTMSDLASASLASVIEQWVGLGYNRRAKYLHEASKLVVSGAQPASLEAIVRLPGVGKNTAAAIMNYVYNTPVPFVETNIRTVYINYFFANQGDVTDAQILEKVAATIDRDNAREWFWALMDYGAYLKARGQASLSSSRHYKKQSPLDGSIRQLRGWIIAELSTGAMPLAQLQEKYGRDSRYKIALEGLKKDGLLELTGDILHLTK